MQFSHAPVVAVEEGHEVFSKVALVDRVEGAHDAEIDGHVATILTDKQVPRMHVCVKEVMPEYLGKEDFHSTLGECFQIDIVVAQSLDIADLDAINAFHDHDLRTAVVPVHFRYIQQVGAGKVAPQLRGVGRLAQQVELIVECFFELGDHLARTQAFTHRPVTLGQVCHRVQQADVTRDVLLHMGA